MNRTTLIIVACGIFFALLAAMAVQMIGAGKREAAPVAQTQMVDVLVAAKDIAIGEELTTGATEWASWPKTAAFSGAITREGEQSAGEALTGRTVRAVKKGEPMMKSAMIDDTKSNFVAASLTPGNRAVSIKVSAETSVAGFVLPGDRVDIILTYDVKLPGNDKIREAAMPVVTKLAAETILENIRVLATDQDTGKKTEAKVGKTVTLEVDPRQAETLILAEEMGNLSLVLRSIGDDVATTASDDVKTTTDLRVSRVMKEIMKGENNTGSLTPIVRIYNGAHVQNVEVRPYSTLQ